MKKRIFKASGGLSGTSVPRPVAAGVGQEVGAWVGGRPPVRLELQLFELECVDP